MGVITHRNEIQNSYIQHKAHATTIAIIATTILVAGLVLGYIGLTTPLGPNRDLCIASGAMIFVSSAALFGVSCKIYGMGRAVTVAQHVLHAKLENANNQEVRLQTQVTTLQQERKKGDSAHEELKNKYVELRTQFGVLQEIESTYIESQERSKKNDQQLTVKFDTLWQEYEKTVAERAEFKAMLDSQLEPKSVVADIPTPAEISCVAPNAMVIEPEVDVTFAFDEGNESLAPMFVTFNLSDLTSDSFCMAPSEALAREVRIEVCHASIQKILTEEEESSSPLQKEQIANLKKLQKELIDLLTKEGLPTSERRIERLVEKQKALSESINAKVSASENAKSECSEYRVVEELLYIEKEVKIFIDDILAAQKSITLTKSRIAGDHLGLIHALENRLSCLSDNWEILIPIIEDYTQPSLNESMGGIFF